MQHLYEILVTSEAKSNDRNYDDSFHALGPDDAEKWFAEQGYTVEYSGGGYGSDDQFFSKQAIPQSVLRAFHKHVSARWSAEEHSIGHWVWSADENGEPDDTIDDHPGNYVVEEDGVYTAE